MSDPGRESDANRRIRRGETYTHDKHGLVEVNGIWKGVNQVDEAHRSGDQDRHIVRFSTKNDGTSVDELTTTLDQFLKMIEG